MNVIFCIIACIVVIALLPVALKIAIQVIWNIIELPYRIVMVVFYCIAYVAISVYEVVVWLVRLPFRIAGWFSRRFRR